MESVLVEALELLAVLVLLMAVIIAPIVGIVHLICAKGKWWILLLLPYMYLLCAFIVWNDKCEKKHLNILGQPVQQVKSVS